MKIISWNVNGIRKGVSNELFNIINTLDPDIICMQETRATEDDIHKYFKNTLLFDLYPFSYFNDSVNGQAGVCILSRIKPLHVFYEIPRMFQIKYGRIIFLEFSDFMLLNTYVPNTGREIAEDYRKVWHNSLMSWLPSKISKKFFIWCGDLNVVDDPALDTSHHIVRPKKNPPAGLKQFEKDQFDKYINLGLVDVFRYLYPDTIAFTWFSNRHKDVGWRLDYFLVNDISKVKDIFIHKRLPKSVSDHVPILLEF